MRTLLIASLAIALSGCDRNERATQTEAEERSVTRNTESARPAADDTERNERDRDPNALTPTDQGGSEADRNVTQEIRQRVMQQDNLSMNAKNVKIITNEGVVTLRGPVESAEERAAIERLAQGVPGTQRIDNQLEVITR